MIVILKKPIKDFPFKIRWWANVTVTPEDKRTTEFSKGTFKGLKVSRPNGGHIWPISTVGDTPEWKNAQKKEIKNKTSEVINKIIPIFNDKITKSECNPWRKDSRDTSRHQIILTRTKINRVNNSNIFRCIRVNKDKNLERHKKDAIRGHGLTSTKWNFVKFTIIKKILKPIKRIPNYFHNQEKKGENKQQ